MTPDRRGSGERSEAGEPSSDRWTRRQLLVGTATAGAASLAGCTGGGSGSVPGVDSPTTTETPAHPDVDVLNYLLGLEHLEQALYQRGLKRFGGKQLRNAEPVSRFGEAIRSSVPARLEAAREQERGHADLLANLVRDLGGQPVEADSYTFKFDTPTVFLNTARVVEDTVVAAYKGAAPALTSDDLLTSVLSIHSVEARHAGYLDLLNRQSPYPRAFDAPQSPRQVNQSTGEFVDADTSAGGTNLSSDAEPTADRKQDSGEGVVTVLNDALALEHLEHALYERGLKRFGEDQLRSAEVLSAFSPEFRESVPDRLRTIRDQERAHVDTLRSAVRDRGGKPVKPASYTFGLDSPTALVRTARELENVRVGAYAGAAPKLAKEPVFKATVKLHSVEARHAGFLNLLDGKSPYPSATDEPLSREAVREAIAPYVEGRSNGTTAENNINNH